MENGWNKGFIAQGEADILFVNCKSEGELSCGQSSVFAGYFFGYGLSYYTNNNAKVSITDCDLKLKGSLPIVGNLMGKDESREVSLLISDCKVKYEDFQKATFYLGLYGKHTSKVDICINNVEFNINGYSYYNLFLYTGISNKSVIEIENVLFKTNMGLMQTTKLKNTIKESLSGNSDCFYGSDFSDFYVDFKTGKIGLKALSGKGFYQGKVTEEWLLSKGFEKKG